MSLAVHNVVQLSDDEVRNRFVVRRLELDELLAHLNEPAPPRHALVVGPRGMGKSLLLRRVAVEVAGNPELAARWLPLVMAEELYEVTSIGELWLAVLARLAAVVEDADLVAQHRVLLAEPDPARLETLALQRVLAAARARGQRVLLLAENLDMLLGDQVASEEGWTLRQALQTEPEILLMASAVTTFAQVEEAGEALYGFFHRVDLRPLPDAEVRTLWREVTGVDLAGDRVVPIRILTGGNPRLITVLGRFSKQPNLGSLRQDLEMLIDEYTPFFKANIETLPPVERKVFVTLADIWAPATAAEVAKRARLDRNKVSSLLGRLMRRGAVQIVEDEPGRRRYELTERLYNLYHLLRRPGGDGRVRALVDILVHLYEPGQLEHEVWPNIVQPPMEGLCELDVAVASRLQRYLDEAGVWNYKSTKTYVDRLGLFQSLLESQKASLGGDVPETMLTRQHIAFCLGAGGSPGKALQLDQDLLVEQERILGHNHPDTLTTRRHVAYFTGESGDPTTALALFRRVFADQERILGPDDPATLATRAYVADFTGASGDPTTALALFRLVLADQERILGPDDPATLATRHQVAHYTGVTGDPTTALALYRQGLADQERILGPDDPATLASRHQVAYYTGLTGHPTTALELYRQVLADRERILGPDDPATLASRYQFVFLTHMTGGGTSLKLAEDLLHRAEASLAPEDELLGAARSLQTYLSIRAAASGRPLPRELRELQDVLDGLDDSTSQ